MYHLMEQNRRDVEKEREKVAAANAALVAATAAAVQQQAQSNLLGGASSMLTSTPCPLPLSPTSMIPFFASQTNNGNLSQSDLVPHIVTEVFSTDINDPHSKNNLIMEDVQEEMDESKQSSTTVRRHTLGPSGGQKDQLPKTSLQNFPPYNSQLYRAILPQTNLTQYLPLVCNLPPESFSAKDPHLLKPPPSLGADFITSAIVRRASDGGAYTAQSSPENEQPNLGEGKLKTDGFDGIPTSPVPIEQSSLSNTEVNLALQALSDSPNHASIATCVAPKRGSGVMGNSTNVTNPIDSPRKRRTGLHTVLEKPPEIHPELVQEVEIRMQQNQSPAQQHLTVTSITNTPPFSPLLSQTSPVGSVGLPEACSSPPITLTPPPGMPMPAPATIISPLMSPSKAGSLRARRTGLSTVMEVGKSSTGKIMGKETTSLLLPTERYSPVRRLSDGAPIFRATHSPLAHSINASSMPSSHDTSPCYTDVRALQEEVLRLQNETQSFGSSLESTASSSGYLSPNRMANLPSCSLCATTHSTTMNSSDVTGKYLYLKINTF